MFLQRVKEIFDLNLPIGRLRYFLTSVILCFIACIPFVVLTPDIFFYEGNESMFQAFQSGIFSKFDVFVYLLADLISCIFEFLLEAKRLLDITDNKKLSLIIPSFIAFIGLSLEYFITNTSKLTIIYIVVTFAFYIFLCLKKGVHTTPKEETSENQETA